MQDAHAPNTADVQPRPPNTATAIAVSPQYAPQMLVLPEDVAVLSRTGEGQRILAAAKTVDGNLALVPAEGATHGFTGVKVQMGRVRQEYNTDLYDLSSRMTVYDEMRRSETAVASMEMLLSMPIAATEFYVLDGDDKQLAEQLRWNISDGLMQHIAPGIPGRPFSRVMREASLAVLMGFAWHYQKIGPVDGGSLGQFIGWKELAPRLQSTVYQWDLDDEGHTLGLVQYGTNPRTMFPEYVYYRRDEIILWSWLDDGGDPEGLGALRRAYRAYKQKDDFQTYAAIRIERQACGIPIAIAPDGVLLTSSEALAVVDFMRSIRTGADSGGAVPFGWDVKMLDLGDATVPFESHIERQHQAMLQTTGVQMVGFGQGGDPGSNALIKGAGEWYSDVILETVADWCCDTFNCEAVPDFCRRNGYTGIKPPKLMHGKVAVRNAEAYGRAINQYFRDRGEIPADVNATVQDVLGVTPTNEIGAPPLLPPAVGGGSNNSRGAGSAGSDDDDAPAQGQSAKQGGSDSGATGDQNGSRRGKLTEDQVRAIRNSDGESAKALAQKFAVDESTIVRIRNGSIWKNVR